MPTISAWHSRTVGSMQTHRRRDLRPRALSRTAEQLLQVIAERGFTGFPRELVAIAGVQERWAWPAIAQLLEQNYVGTSEHGHLRITRAGRQRAGRAA